MRKNFFEVLRSIENDKNRNSLSSQSVALFSRLVDVIETCGFSKSEATKFICKNWREKPADLAESWLVLTGEEKSCHTFRSQISTISTQLFVIFGDIQPSTFGKLSELSAEDIETRKHLVAVLDSFMVTDSFPANIFISEVLNYFEDVKPTKSFDISDCKDELKVLKLLAKTNIYDLLDTCDSDKLKYILSVIRKPLTSNRTRSVNLDKLDILKEFGLVKTSYKMLDGVSAKKENEVVSESVEPSVVSVEPSHRFKMAITNEMAEVLEKRLAEPVTQEDVLAEQAFGDKRERFIQAMVGTFYAMTPEGFESYIKRQNPIMLAEVVNGTFKDHKNVDVDFTDATEETKRFIKYEKSE